MNRLIVASVLLPAVVFADSSADYVNFIRQIQQDTGVEWDVTILPEGSQLSPTGISEQGAHFEMWSIHNTTAAEYLLDEQFVTSYTPNAAVEIFTDDPYEPVRRTRCDQPFQVQVSVAGLLGESDPSYVTAPDAAKRVRYLHTAFSYPEGSHSLEEVSDPVGDLIAEGLMEENGTATVTFAVTNLTGPDLTQVEGEEVFTVSALADFGVSATILDSERVQIWPVATGTISGFDPTESYEKVPPVTVHLTDLYPDSRTYVRIYPGPSQTDPSDAVTVSASVVVINNSIPQDRTVLLDDIDRYLVTEGLHTMELMHITPFGLDILYSGAIQVDRTVEVVGGINTLK